MTATNLIEQNLLRLWEHDSIELWTWSYFAAWAGLSDETVSMFLEVFDTEGRESAAAFMQCHERLQGYSVPLDDEGWKEFSFCSAHYWRHVASVSGDYFFRTPFTWRRPLPTAADG